jgi:DNA adenine methylase
MHLRPILKWPGGKFRLLDKILRLLPKREALVEPFVGSGVVFLNTDYDFYRLSDCNPDLIDLYTQLQTQGQAFIDHAKRLFTPRHNQEKRYYALREEFNAMPAGADRAALFLYLNRHGFNGLCRYNQSGGYNVPYGQYKEPYFPEDEMRLFAAKSQRAVFQCADFTESLSNVPNKSVIYADPPYVPLTATASFTQYARGGFDHAQQEALASLAQKLSREGVAVLLSNHDTPFTRQVYAGAQLTSFKVMRNISATTKGRKHVKELLALYLPDPSDQPT